MEKTFTKDILKIEVEKEVDRITTSIRNILSLNLKRRGLVVGLSGGIDSSVTVSLAARAIGPDRVLALLMPERHSSPDTLHLSRKVAKACGVLYKHEDISEILDAVGFYRRYEDAVRQVVPEYGDQWKSKIVITNIFEKKGFSVFSIVTKDPEGKEIKKRLPLNAYLAIVAATNFKQRIRKMMEYYYADCRHYAVAGTPNRLEYDQGFFVKNGDGAADIKPIAHLYKTQLYQLAPHLGLPDEILARPPTTDTYSLSQGQDEFFFSLPYEKMDLCLYGKNHGYSPSDVAGAVELTPDQVKRVYDDIETKRATTRYLHLTGLLVEEVPMVKSMVGT